ncbi:MAG: SMP-30/gluconolactonase/LRE family protein [Candidatus Nanopelagicales bacterium]
MVKVSSPTVPDSARRSLTTAREWLGATTARVLGPAGFDPAVWVPPPAPEPVGVLAVNHALAAVEVIAGNCPGPESVAVAADGSLYTGLADGRIVQVAADGSSVRDVATAGRPLGMQVAPDGRLFVADARRGLIAVDPRTGEVTTLADHVDGAPINCADDLAVASDGTVFLSDASTKYPIEQYLTDLVEHRPNGRLLAHDLGTGTTKVLLDGLHFANGVTLSPDQDYLLVAESGMYRVLRLWLQGPRAGQSEVFADNLPGGPDNITTSPDGLYWVALPGGPQSRATADPLMPHPLLRRALMRAPRPLRERFPKTGYVLALDPDGQITRTLQDPTGSRYPFITSVLEHEGMLYLGSSDTHGIGVLPAPRH